MLDHNAMLPKNYLPTAEQLSLSVDDQPVRIIRMQHFDQPIYFAHISCADGPHEAEITIKRKQSRLKLYPERHGIRLRASSVKCRYPSVLFAFTDQPYLVLWSDALGYICIHIEPFQSQPKGDRVLLATEAGINQNSDDIQTAAFQTALNRISNSDALDTLCLPAGLYRTGSLNIPSHCRLHLNSGAVLMASDKALEMNPHSSHVEHKSSMGLLHTQDARSVSISGHGHIDGNRRTLALQGYSQGLILMCDSSDICIQGPILSDSAGWNTTFRRCENVTFKRIKILNNRPLIKCINTDGCNPDGSQNVLIEQCFMHTGDDAVAVKSSEYDGQPGRIQNITVRDLLAINNSSTAKIGTETMADIMDEISFERIDAIRTNRLVVIDAYDHARITNVSFKDCHAHELENDWYEPRLVDIQAPLQAFRPLAAKATIKGVRLTNISCSHTASGRILNRMDATGPAISDIEISDISAGGHALQLDQLMADGENDNYRELAIRMDIPMPT